MSVAHELPEEADTTVGQRGRLFLPAALQRAAGIHEGSRVHLRVVENGTVLVETFDAIKRRLQVPNPSGGTPGTDALRVERRQQMSEEDR